MIGRFRWVLLPLVFVGMVAAGSGSILLISKQEKAPSDDKRFSALTHDFGKVRAGEVIQHTFMVANPGAALLRVEGVQSTCGCTVAGIESKEIPPGGAVEMPVTLKTAGKSGNVSQPVTVLFSGGKTSTYTLRGFVVSYELEPLKLGTVLRGIEVKKEVSLRWPPGLALEVQSVRFNEEKLAVDVTPGDGFHHISIALRNDAPYGPLSESVFLQTNDPIAPEKLVNVSATIPYPVSCEPAQVMLGLVHAGETVTGLTHVVSPYSRPVRIDAVEHREGLPVQWREERISESEIALHISLSPDTERSYYKSVLRVTATAGEDSRPLDVEVYGIGPNVALQHSQ